jgi:hypothetical protein
MWLVRRRSLTVWLLALPLMVAGSQFAHAAAYRFVYPAAHVRVEELLSTGHGYMGYPGYLPMLLGLGLAAEVVWLGTVLLGAARGPVARRAGRISPWLFAALPLLGFTLQELLERWLSGTGFPWWMVLQPTFRVGLALQIPFAVAAYLVARFAQRTAEHVELALRPVASRMLVAAAEVVAPFDDVVAPRRGVLADGCSGRGPPYGAPALVALAR